jgi:NADPH-dependent curcumin reductase CurA
MIGGSLYVLRAAVELCLVSFIYRADYTARFPEALSELGRWISEGRIIRKYHVVEGLESAPESLPLLFTGGNNGKLSVLPRPRCWSVQLTVS